MLGFPIIFKLLTPKVIKGLLSYVFEKNVLDIKVEQLESIIKELEKNNHPPMFSQADKEDMIKRISRLEDRNA